MAKGMVKTELGKINSKYVYDICIKSSGPSPHTEQRNHWRHLGSWKEDSADSEVSPLHSKERDVQHFICSFQFS